MTRSEIKSNMARALYTYATKRKEANWEGKRSGIVLPSISANVKSCGAFRAWAVLLAKGRLCVCIDGYRVRSDIYENRQATCEVSVLIGDGQFVFPYDASCSHHSLAMACSAGKIVSVTNDETVAWEQELIDLTNELNAAAEAVCKAVEDYDTAKREQNRANRERESMEARQALLAK